MKMNKKLILELNHQRKLMGLLNEGLIKGFVEGMKNLIKIGEGETANISLFRGIYNSMDGAVISELESLGIKNFDEMAQDLRLPFKVGGRVNPAKKILDATAEKIANAFEKVIFKDKRFSNLGDMVVESFFNMKNANQYTRQKYYQLVDYAKNGQEDQMLSLSKELEPYIDKTFLDFARSKYVSKVIADNATPKNWWQNLWNGVARGSKLSLMFKSGYKDIPSDETDKLFTRFFALANSIEEKMSKTTGDYAFDFEKVEMAKLAAEIARVKRDNLRNLWLKWREFMPKDMIAQIEKEGVENSPKYIEFVRYFENNAGLPVGGVEGKKLLERPELLVSRLKGLKRLVTGDKSRNTWVGRNIFSRLERLVTGFFFSDPRTFKEWFSNYEILGRSKARMVGFTIAEKTIGCFIYYPIIMGTIQSLYDLAEKDLGYKKDAKGNLLIDPKTNKPIPNWDLWGADGSKFLSDHKEGINSFFQVWCANTGKKYGFATDEVLNFKAASYAMGLAWDFYRRKDITNKPEDIGTDKVSMKEKAKGEMNNNIQKVGAEVDSLKKKLSDMTSNLDSTTKNAADKFIRQADSIRSSITGKTDKMFNTVDSVEF